tara:strand:+ start:191 stop:394 length:204 start_codon:yes stop_codon:yes gene_type:complete
MPKRFHHDMMEIEEEQKENIQKRKYNTRSIACQTDLRVFSEEEVHKMMQQCNQHLDNIKWPMARWVY